MARKPTSALIAIDIEGTIADPALRGHCARRMRQALARLALAPTSVRIDFADLSGPKGGVDRRCAMTVHLARRPARHVEHVAEAPLAAFEGALDALERRLTRSRQREREAGRRPKKYYVAKRVLAGEAPELPRVSA